MCHLSLQVILFNGSHNAGIFGNELPEAWWITNNAIFFAREEKSDTTAYLHCNRRVGGGGGGSQQASEYTWPVCDITVAQSAPAYRATSWHNDGVGVAKPTRKCAKTVSNRLRIGKWKKHVKIAYNVIPFGHRMAFHTLIRIFSLACYLEWRRL